MLGNASDSIPDSTLFRSVEIPEHQTHRPDRGNRPMELFSSSLADVLTKIAMFLVVQALVYLILSKSSDVFSKDKKPRSLSFKQARSVSIRRILAALSDLPAGGEPSPRPERPRVEDEGIDSSAN